MTFLGMTFLGINFLVALYSHRKFEKKSKPAIQKENQSKLENHRKQSNKNPLLIFQTKIKKKQKKNFSHRN
jgi:hypothetical protein